MHPLGFFYTQLEPAMALVYFSLTYMTLPIYVSLEKIDRRLIEAAFDLGADRWRALRRVILPLAPPGIIGGALLGFVPALRALLTPEVLCGGETLLIGPPAPTHIAPGRHMAVVSAP